MRAGRPDGFERRAELGIDTEVELVVNAPVLLIGAQGRRLGECLDGDRVGAGMQHGARVDPQELAPRIVAVFINPGVVVGHVRR